jgi:hypothetical protein
MVIRCRIRERNVGGKTLYRVQQSFVPLLWRTVLETEERREAERLCASIRKMAERVL